MSNSLPRRNRRSTGENIQTERMLNQSGRRSLPIVNLKEVLDSAKMKFETEQDENSLLSVPVNNSDEDQKGKASSAPASPVKSLTVSVPSSIPICDNVVSSTRSRHLRSESTSPKAKLSSLLMPANTKTEYSNTDQVKVDNSEGSNSDVQQSALLDDSKKAKKNAPKGVSMSEVIRLHQDEGVINLLHALPRSRRRSSATHHVGSHPPAKRRRPSNEVERGAASKGMTQGTDSGRSALSSVWYRRHINPDNVLANVINSANIQPCTQDELLTQSSMEILKQLPSKDYLNLWSHQARYTMIAPVNNENEFSNNINENNVGDHEMASSQAGHSPSGSVTSMESSASKSLNDLVQLHNHNKQINFVRPVPWRIQSKHYKDIQIRTHSSFVQIILSPSSTGLRHSINSNVCEELIDCLKQVEDIPVRGVLLTGIGETFCQGIDLTVLTHEGSADKQKRAAELLANGVKKLVRQLLNFPKILVVAVNGKANGLGVSILPYFDIVYANDKAEFSMDYSRIGQIPDGFASQTSLANSPELLLGLQTMTASMAQAAGFVNNVIWPSKFLETIVPKMESLDFMNVTGLRLVKQSLKKTMRAKVLAVLEEETNILIATWSSIEFAKLIRNYLKSSHLVFQ